MEQFFNDFIAELEKDDTKKNVEEGTTTSQHHHHQHQHHVVPTVDQEEEESKFSTNACTHCRHSHLACDRVKPCCSECAMRGRTCQYMPLKKRGRVKGSKKNISPSSTSSKSNKKLVTIAPTHKITIGKEQRSVGFHHPYHQSDHLRKENQIMKENVLFSIINYFYDFVNINFDLISREQMQEIASNLHMFETEYGVKTMLLAIQSLCEQNLSQPERSSKSVLEFVHYHKLAHPLEFCTKVGVLLITHYAVGEGDFEMLDNYLQQIKNFQSDFTLNDYYKAKFSLFVSKTEMYASTRDDDVENFKSVWKGFTKFYQGYGSDMNKFDLESISRGITIENASQTLNLIHIVRDILYEMASKSKLSEQQQKLKYISIELMYTNGIFASLKLLNFKGNALDELAERMELLLTNFSLSLPLYSFLNLAVFIRHRIDQFSSIQEKVAEKVRQGKDIRSIFEEEEEKKYFGIILLYLKLVNSFISRYRLIDKSFPKLISELRYIIKWKFDVQMNSLPRVLMDDMSNNIQPEKESSHITQYQSSFEKNRANNHIYSI